jgi:glycosyltransferase involved in cell wall biosynthesis
MTQRSPRLRTVFLTCPYGQVGGGMGSIMEYLAALRTDPSGRFRLARLESRGGGRLIFSPFFLALAVCRILAEGARGRLAVVHLNLAERGSVYRKATLLYAAKLVGARVLLHLHAAQIVALQQTMPRFGRFLLRSMFRSADRVVVLGELWRRWVIDTLGVAPHAVTVLRNGVPATMVPRVARPAGQPFRLLFLGNLLQRKGIADLLHALAAAQGAPVTLTVAGGGPVETYRQMADGLGIGGRVHFTGWVDQATARDLLAASDALVLPAYDEGLPLVILEALATGVPVICTPVGAIPEVFEDHRTALFVSPGDRAGLASAVAALAGDAGLQTRLSDEGLALYQRDFTMDVFATRISALYAALDRPRVQRQAVAMDRVAEAGDDR